MAGRTEDRFKSGCSGKTGRNLLWLIERGDKEEKGTTEDTWVSAPGSWAGGGSDWEHRGEAVWAKESEEWR